MNRRHVLYGGAAAVAAAAGAGAAWWSARTSVAGPGAASDPAANAFWSLAFDTPDGASLATASLRGKPLLVNFWATWCPPCIEELPLLNRFYEDNKAGNWQVLGLAVDQPSAVRNWLRTKPLAFPVGMAGFNGTELSKTLGNLAGSLPFSVVFGVGGEVLHRKIGKISSGDLAQWRLLK